MLTSIATLSGFARGSLLPATWLDRDAPSLVAERQGSLTFYGMGTLPGWAATALADNQIALGTTVTIFEPDTMSLKPADRTAEQLISYLNLAENWDGEGASTPSSAAIEDALDMLATVPEEIAAPKPMVLPSGDVALYWDDGQRYAEIGFDGSGTYYAFAASPGRSDLHLNDILLRGEDGTCRFPEVLLAMLMPGEVPASA